MNSSRSPWLARLTGSSLLVASCLWLRCAGAEDYFPPSDQEGGWRTARDEAQIRDKAGMRLDRLDQAFDYTQRCSQNGGLLVVRHGYLAYERYFGRAHRNTNPDMACPGKAYTSIACGILLHEFRSAIPDPTVTWRVRRGTPTTSLEPEDSAFLWCPHSGS